jgi:plasmid stabilization system protein ParE
LTYRLEITARARDDADAAYDWMAENISPAFAGKWYQGLFQQIETLAKHPTRCPVAPESRKFPEKIQELVYGKARHKHKYRILFTIRDDVVVILYVYHSARKELEA